MALTAGLENALLIEHIVVFYVINFILLEDSTWSGKDARWGKGEQQLWDATNDAARELEKFSFCIITHV